MSWDSSQNNTEVKREKKCWNTEFELLPLPTQKFIMEQTRESLSAPHPSEGIYESLQMLSFWVEKWTSAKRKTYIFAGAESWMDSEVWGVLWEAARADFWVAKAGGSLKWGNGTSAIPAVCLSNFPHSSKFIHFTPQLLLKQCMVGRTQTMLWTSLEHNSAVKIPHILSWQTAPLCKRCWHHHGRHRKVSDGIRSPER